MGSSHTDAGTALTPAAFATPSRKRMLVRALLLKCPHCGGGNIFSNFFTLRETCPTCSLQLERGEGDYFVGAYLFNLIAVELILFFCVCGFVYVTWPSPPWDLITYVTAFLMLSGCFICYPFSKTTWLAVDMSIRPLSQAELDKTGSAEW